MTATTRQLAPAPVARISTFRSGIIESLPVLIPGLLAASLAATSIARPSLWADEVATWSASTRSWSQLWRLVHHQDAVFAPYYSAMHLWTWLVGSSPVALRAPSAVAAVATVLVTGQLARRLHGRTAGAAAAASLALNPFFMFYAIDARPYALVALIAAATTRRLLDDRARPAAVGALSALGVLLHLYYAFVIVGQVLALAVTDRSSTRRRLWALAPALVVATGIATVGWTQRRQVGWLPHTRPADVALWWEHLTGYGTAGLIVAVLALAGMSSRQLGARDRAVLALTCAFGPVVLVLVSLRWPLYDSRYVIESAPMIAVAAGCGVGRGLTWARSRRWLRPGRLAVAAAASLVVLLAASTWLDLARPYFHENLAAAADELRDQPRSGTAVAFEPAEARGALYYYLDRDQDGDLPVDDITAAPGTNPVQDANFSGANSSLAGGVRRVSDIRRLVVVDLGAAAGKIAETLRADHLVPCGSAAFGQMSLLYFCRR